MARTFKEAIGEYLPRGVRGRENKSVAAEWGGVWATGRSEFPYGKGTENAYKGVFLGYDGEGRDGRPVGFTDDRHVVTIAGSRAGKGRSLIIPNMLMYEGSTLAIDPKGELARVASRARAELGQKVFVLDPFEVSLKGCKTDEQRAMLQGRLASYNPLSELDPASPTFVDDTAVLANALIKEGRSNDRFWSDSARMLVHALILFVFRLPVAARNLCVVRDLLMLRGAFMAELVDKLEGIKPQKALWEAMRVTGDDVFEGIVKSAGETFGTMHDDGISSVLATARTETAFLDSPKLREILRSPEPGDSGRQARTFRLRDLKREKVSVYLCLPAGRMSSHANWLRIFIELALQAFEDDVGHKPDAPLLMVLDEFPVLGYMRSLEAAAGQIAGFSVKMWIVVQDITQLERLYRESWQTFIGNAGVLTAFANTDAKTLGYLSEKLGKINMDVSRESNASAAQRRAGAAPTQMVQRDDPLLAPHEIEIALGRDRMSVLVLAAGTPPLVLQRALYDRDINFQGKFDP